MKHRPLNLSSLTLQEFRESTRQKKNAFLPDQVAASLADRGFLLGPGTVEAMQEELPRLIAELRDRLHEDGIDLDESNTPESTYTRREISRAANLSTLLAFHAHALSPSDEESSAVAEIEEGKAWARFAGSARREAFIYGVSAHLHLARREVTEEIDAWKDALGCLDADQGKPGGDPEMEILLLGLLGSSLITYVRIDEAEEVTDRGITLAESLDASRRDYLLPYLLMNRARISTARGQRQEAILLLEEGRGLAERSGPDHPHLPPILFHLANMYRSLKDRGATLEMHNETIRVAESLDDTTGVIWSYLQIAALHLSFNELDLAERALDIAESFPSSPFHREYLYVRRISQLGLQGRYDEAFEYGRKMTEMFGEGEISPMLPVMHYHLGVIRAAQGDLEGAEESWRTALDICDRLRDAEPPFPAWFALTDLLLRTGRGDEAMEVLEVITDRFDVETLPDLIRTRILELQTTHAEMHGELATALERAREQIEITVRHYNTEMTESLERARILNEISLYRKDAEVQAMKRAEAERSLSETLLDFENRRLALNSMESRLREVLSMLDNVRARELVEELKHAIANIESSVEQPDTSLHYMLTVEREFFERLRERYPDLTRRQERFCGLIRAGLSSKEIAAALNISTEGIRSQRKRLRKRLGLTADENLESAILEI